MVVVFRDRTLARRKIDACAVFVLSRCGAISENLLYRVNGSLRLIQIRDRRHTICSTYGNVLPLGRNGGEDEEANHQDQARQPIMLAKLRLKHKGNSLGRMQAGAYLVIVLKVGTRIQIRPSVCRTLTNI
jgi:hypothetical protein